MSAGTLNVLQSKIAGGLIQTHGIHTFQPLEHRASGLRLLCFLPCEVLANEIFRFRDQPLLVLIRATLNLATLFAFLEIMRIVSFVAGCLAVFQFDNPLTCSIQKVSIVGNYHEGRRVSLQKLLEPLDCANIKMVGGLIEKQNIRVRKKQSR